MMPAMQRFWRSPLAPWALAAVTFLAFPQGYLGKDHDDALYVLAARAIAEGHYRLWFLPGNLPITAFTPGLPALMAPVAAVWPDAFGLYQLLNALFLAAAVFWLAREGRYGLALAAGFALNPLVLSRVGIVMPEAAFLVAALAAFWFLDKSPSATGAALLAAYLIRPAALPLWGAAWIVLLLRRQYRELVPAALIPLLGLAAWTAWCRSAGGLAETGELARYYGPLGAAGWLATWAANAGHLLRAWGSTLLPLPLAKTALAYAAGATAWALALRGIYLSFRQKNPPPGDVFVALSLAMHLFWPWWYDRYLLPLLPFLLAAAWRGLPPRAARHPKTPLALAALLAAAFFGQALFLTGTRRAPPAPDAYTWVKTHTNPGDTFVSPFYGRDLIYTGRVFLPLPGGEAAAWEEDLKRRRVRYVFWPTEFDVGFSRADNAVNRGLDGYGAWLREPARFRPVFTDPSGTVIYERLF